MHEEDDSLRETMYDVPGGLDVHIVLDNYATHKTPKIKRGSPAGRIIISISRRLPRHGSIRSSAGPALRVGGSSYPACANAVF
jgi:hypothetical protein